MIIFYASRSHLIDHLAPVFHQFGSEQAQFWVMPALIDYAWSKGIEAFPSERQAGLYYPTAKGDAAVVCASNDAQSVHKVNGHRKIILMEHGPGIVFPHNAGYAGGDGIRRKVNLFLPPNQLVYNKTAQTMPGARQVIIGTPMLDKWSTITFPLPTEVKVFISFHWNGAGVQPEAGTALDHYKKVLPFLAKRTEFQIVGHGHPRIMDDLIPLYNDCEIQWTRDFEDVIRDGYVYLNDASSTIYMAGIFMPVIFLNAPWFRKDINFGLRWWEYTDFGSHCEEPKELLGLIERTLANPFEYSEERKKMRMDLFPYLGESSERAMNVIKEYLYG